MADERAEFQELLRTGAENVNVHRESMAKRIASIVASIGDHPIDNVDVTVAMARIDTILDEYYGSTPEDEDAAFRKAILEGTAAARVLAVGQSNRIIEEELAGEPDLIEMVRLT